MPRLIVGFIVSSLYLVGCDAEVPAGVEPDQAQNLAGPQEEMIELELLATDQILAQEYVYCLTGDDDATVELLSGWFADAGLEDAPSVAASVVADGWCAARLAVLDGSNPWLLGEVTSALSNAGFDPSVAFTLQGTPATRDAVIDDIVDEGPFGLPGPGDGWVYFRIAPNTWCCFRSFF